MSGYTAAVVAIGSAVFTAVGQVQAGKAAKNEANYKKNVAQQQAQREREVAAQQADDFKRDQSDKLAHRRATIGGRGGPGRSESLVVEDFESDAQYKASLIRDQGEASATRLDQSASLLGYQGKNAQTGSYWDAGGTLARAGAGLAKGIGGTTKKPGSAAKAAGWDAGGYEGSF